MSISFHQEERAFRLDTPGSTYRDPAAIVHVPQESGLVCKGDQIGGARGIQTECPLLLVNLITLHGSWAYERMIQRRRLGWGIQGVCSQRGISSHSGQPFARAPG